MRFERSTQTNKRWREREYSGDFSMLSLHWIKSCSLINRIVICIS